MLPNPPVTFPNGWKPTLYVPLRAQVLMGMQADLFDFSPSGTPACAHRFDPCEQLTLEGGTARICTLCGDNEPIGSGTAQSRASGPVILRISEGEFMTIRDIISVQIDAHTSGHHRFDIWQSDSPEPPYDAEGPSWLVILFGEVGA